MLRTNTELLRPPQTLALPNLDSRCVLTIVTERRSYTSNDNNPYLRDEEEQLIVCKGYIESTTSVSHSKDPMLGTSLRQPVTVNMYMPQHGRSSVRAFKDVAALSYAFRQCRGKATDIPEVLATTQKHPEDIDRSLRDVIGDLWPSVLHFVIFEFEPLENPFEDPGEQLVPVTFAGSRTRGRSRVRSSRGPPPMRPPLPQRPEESPLGMRSRLRRVMNVFQPSGVQPKKHPSSVGAGRHLTQEAATQQPASPHTPRYDDDDDDDGSLFSRGREWTYTPSSYGSRPQRAMPTSILNDEIGFEKRDRASVAICGTPSALTELGVSLT